jgi:hypothetical protein
MRRVGAFTTPSQSVGVVAKTVTIESCSACNGRVYVVENEDGIVTRKCRNANPPTRSDAPSRWELWKERGRLALLVLLPAVIGLAYFTDPRTAPTNAGVSEVVPIMIVGGAIGVCRKPPRQRVLDARPRRFRRTPHSSRRVVPRNRSRDHDRLR